MPQHVTPRQPLSCENCRKRKIKCAGDQVPCKTCVRRGHSQSCYFKKWAEGPQQSLPNANELLYRIKTLEDLLKGQNFCLARSPSEPSVNSASTRTESTSTYAASESLALTNPVQQSGVIITTPSGHQQYSSQNTLLDGSIIPEAVDSIPGLMLTSNFPFSNDIVGSRIALLDALPPLRQCDELKSVFFEVFSPLFHVLHDPTFDAMYENFRSDPSTVALSWLALLFVVLAIAATALDESHPLLKDLGREPSPTANLKKLSMKYRSAAMQCLTADQFLFQHNLHTIQTLVLLIYAMNHANIPSWALLGMTWNMAVKIGCHIDPTALGIGIVEGEERRRCWAALMMLYTVQNTCLGNIAPQIFTADVQLPVDMEDEDLKDVHLVNDGINDGSRMPTKMSYILYKFRLYKIAAEICQHGVNQALPNEQTVFALDQKLACEEQEHIVRFSGHKLPLYHIVHHYILQSYTHHLYLVLHRPLLNLESTSDEALLQSRQRCKTSATTILDIHSNLYETEVFRPYRWYVYGLGSFHAFLAASVLIALSLNASSKADNEYPRLHALVEQCLQRFENMASRSDICAKAHAILQQVLHKDNLVGTVTSNAVENSSLSIPQDSYRGCQLNSTFDPEHLSPDLSDWSLNPGLEALLFDATPQQWIAPSSFTWSRWDGTTLV